MLFNIFISSIDYDYTDSDAMFSNGEFRLSFFNYKFLVITLFIVCDLDH